MPQTLAQVQALHDIFGYDVVICGEMLGEVWMGDTFLYFIEIA